jgi:hypothetical protein
MLRPWVVVRERYAGIASILELLEQPALIYAVSVRAQRLEGDARSARVVAVTSDDVIGSPRSTSSPAAETRDNRRQEHISQKIIITDIDQQYLSNVCNKIQNC